MAEAKEKAPEAEAPERDKKKNDILKEAEENRADNNKDELNVINDPPENAGGINAAYNSIPKRCRDLLKNSEEFDRCAEVFDTKKRGRLFNWNSSEYNSAKKAVEEFRASRDSLNSFIEREAGKRGFEMGLTAKRLDFENKERILEEKLSKYIRKVTKGGKLSAGTKDLFTNNFSICLSFSPIALTKNQLHSSLCA